MSARKQGNKRHPDEPKEGDEEKAHSQTPR